MTGQTANELTASILQYLRLRKFFAWRQNSGAMKVGARYVQFGATGAGDILALRDGRFYSIEVKIGRDRLRDSQLQWMDAVRQHGGTAIVARSLQDVRDVVEVRERAAVAE